ncbi:MAG: phosphatidylserine decarboxylase family protein [Gemmatimonadetes bacterium]|nr:phosphatidylserine decarboxylase family protein [Gemmatimonadota bacterium]
MERPGTAAIVALGSGARDQHQVSGRVSAHYRQFPTGRFVKFAPEGRLFLALGGLILLALAALAWRRGGGWYFPLALWIPVAIWLPIFFRDPAREGPRGERLIISPADGLVVSVAEVDESSYVGGRATRISIFMSIFDVHVNRYPVSGTVELRDYRSGRFINASLDKASEGNERMSLGIRASRGRVLVRQIAGLIARRIVTDAVVGAEVRQGERLGMIRFGSRVDTFAAGAQPRVKVGERVKAGRSVVAEWPE